VTMPGTAEPDPLIQLAKIDFPQIVLFHQFDQFANAIDVENIARFFIRLRHDAALSSKIQKGGCTIRQSLYPHRRCSPRTARGGTNESETGVNRLEIWHWLLGPAGSLWSIRIAMALLAVAYAVQFRTGVRHSRQLAVLGALGAGMATYHTWTSLSAFHGGSLTEAIESTARRTDALLGIRVGEGVYVNYAFVAVWWLDASWRWRSRGTGWRWLQIAVDFFLISLSFFGAIVFASGPIRYAGIIVVFVWIWLAIVRRTRSKH
jgi:hypothetical protein